MDKLERWTDEHILAKRGPGFEKMGVSFRLGSSFDGRFVAGAAVGLALSPTTASTFATIGLGVAYYAIFGTLTAATRGMADAWNGSKEKGDRGVVPAVAAFSKMVTQTALTFTRMGLISWKVGTIVLASAPEMLCSLIERKTKGNISDWSKKAGDFFMKVENKSHEVENRFIEAETDLILASSKLGSVRTEATDVYMRLAMAGRALTMDESSTDKDDEVSKRLKEQMDIMDFLPLKNIGLAQQIVRWENLGLTGSWSPEEGLPPVADLFDFAIRKLADKGEEVGGAENFRLKMLASKEKDDLERGIEPSIAPKSRNKRI